MTKHEKLVQIASAMAGRAYAIPCEGITCKGCPMLDFCQSDIRTTADYGTYKQALKAEACRRLTKKAAKQARKMAQQPPSGYTIRFDGTVLYYNTTKGKILVKSLGSLPGEVLLSVGFLMKMAPAEYAAILSSVYPGTKISVVCEQSLADPMAKITYLEVIP